MESGDWDGGKNSAGGSRGGISDSDGESGLGWWNRDWDSGTGILAMSQVNRMVEMGLGVQ